MLFIFLIWFIFSDFFCKLWNIEIQIDSNFYSWIHWFASLSKIFFNCCYFCWSLFMLINSILCTKRVRRGTFSRKSLLHGAYAIFCNICVIWDVFFNTGMICAHLKCWVKGAWLQKCATLLEQKVVFNNFQHFPDIFDNLSHKLSISILSKFMEISCHLR